MMSMANGTSTIIDFVSKNPDCTSKTIHEATGLGKEIVWVTLNKLIKIEWLKRRSELSIATKRMVYRYTISDNALLAIRDYGSFRNYEIAKAEKRVGLLRQGSAT